MKTSLLFVLALLPFAALAAPEEITRISLDGKPGVAAPEQEEGKDGIARIHKIAEGSLELFPASARPAKGTIMIAPGGGYSILAVEHEGREVARMLNGKGWDAAVLNYHVSEGDKTRALAIEDAKRGLELLQKRGQEFHLETKRIGIMGFSAGGHLTARLAHEAAATRPLDFVILMYPAYLEKDGKILDDVAPLKGPVFIYVAGNDKLAPSSVIYEAACKEKGLRAELHKPELGGHGFGLKKDMPEAVREWPDKLGAFLDTVAK